MRKIASSLFMLCLLLLTLWVFSAWLLGANVKESLNNVLQQDNRLADSWLLNQFDYEVLSTKQNVFVTKTQVALHPTDDSVFNLNEASPFILDVEIFSGPLLFFKSGLFNKLGISFGKSIWHISITNKINDKALISNAVLKIDFDNNIQYSVAVNSVAVNKDSSIVNVNGDYDSIKHKGSGKIITDRIRAANTKRLDAALDFHFDADADLETDADDYVDNNVDTHTNSHIGTHNNAHNNISNVNVVLDASDVMVTKPLQSSVDIVVEKFSAKISLNNNKLNALGNILFKPEKASNIPVEQAQIKFNLDDINVEKLSVIAHRFKELQNMHQQSQWVLEEQGELPEGQDKHWLIQDTIKHISNTLPRHIRQQLFNGQQAAIQYTANTRSAGYESTLKGEVLPISAESIIDTVPKNNASFLSLLQARATVQLDDSLKRYLSTYLPLKHSQFELVYKQNKLLMQ